MNKYLIALCAMILCASSLLAKDFSGKEHNGILYQVMENDIKPEASNALVIYLHGRSASGNDNQKQMEQPGVSAIAKYLKKNKMSSYFIVPQCPSDHEWDGRDGRPGYTDKVEELISFYLSSGDIDPDSQLMTRCVSLSPKSRRIRKAALLTSSMERSRGVFLSSASPV